MSMLEEIVINKRKELGSRKKARPIDELLKAVDQIPPPLEFLRDPSSSSHIEKRVALIAEIKRRSPSRGTLAASLDPQQLAKIYAENGASAISILTDVTYFDGNLSDLEQITQQAHHLPVLRKDFIIDPYQIYESRSAGADAVLLIVAALSQKELKEYLILTGKLGMTALVEVHNMKELKIALDSGALVIGINNRDLRDFSVHLETTFQLRPLIPNGIMVVSESGIKTLMDVKKLAQIDVDAVLVGESLVTAADIAGQVRALSSVAYPRRTF